MECVIICVGFPFRKLPTGSSRQGREAALRAGHAALGGTDRAALCTWGRRRALHMGHAEVISLRP